MCWVTNLNPSCLNFKPPMGSSRRGDGRSEWSRLLKANRNNVRSVKEQREDEERIWSEVAAELDYVNPELVRDVYMALVRVVVRNLRKSKFIRLPGFVDAYLVWTAGKVVKNPKVSQDILLPDHFQLRFAPAKRLKEYFKRVADSIAPSK